MWCLLILGSLWGGGQPLRPPTPFQRHEICTAFANALRLPLQICSRSSIASPHQILGPHLSCFMFAIMCCTYSFIVLWWMIGPLCHVQHFCPFVLFVFLCVLVCSVGGLPDPFVARRAAAVLFLLLFSFHCSLGICLSMYYSG